MPPTAAGFGRGGKEAGEGRAGASGSREWPWPAPRQQEAGTYPAAAGRAEGVLTPRLRGRPHDRELGRVGSKHRIG